MIALLALIGVTAGCHRHRRAQREPRAQSVQRTVHMVAADKVIETVISSPVGEGFGFFPHHVGRDRCRIPEGGPVRGKRITGICTTHVTSRAGYSGQTVVVFTQTWLWRLFHYAGKPRRSQRHSWTFVVLPGRKVELVHQGGDFPPQWVM
jgi:hypothetical protein